MPEDERPQGLGALRVLDFTFGIAGAYCTKLLADAGADVIKIEPPEGDPWRNWSAGGATPDPDRGGALFRFLHHGTRSVLGRPGDAHVEELINGADIVVEGFAAEVFDALDIPTRWPGLVWMAVTPYGRTGPLAESPSTEFIIQAESGGLVGRGGPQQVPIMAGGRTSEWVAGTFAAVAVTAAALRAQRDGHGEHVDFSIAETMSIAGGGYAHYGYALSGSPPITKAQRTFETPSIEPSGDGYVGFTTNSRQQLNDFLLLIERPDLLGDEQLATAAGRQARWDEWNRAVHDWTGRHSSAEIVAGASDLRIPVAPVHNGADILDFPHFAARQVFIDDPTGTFKMPRRPWRLDDADPPPPGPSPRLGEHTGGIAARRSARPAPPRGERRLPLEGVRVVDLTAWWAGPVASGLIAALGAEVIHVESVSRPDGMRMTGAALGMEGPWWERSSHYLCSNTNKHGITLDLTTPEGLGLLEQLIARSDVVIENFTPRVMANFGLGRDAIAKLNDQAILVRMPAFGLSGPWRDNTGFAQTMEQVTGMAWVTGHRDDQPRIQRGPSDPNAGMHAAFALLVALAERERTGRGCHLEVTMVEGALNAAAELVIEYTAYGNLLERDGNRSPNAAPQGCYACAGFDQWLAVSVETDGQWRGLCRALGQEEWAQDPNLATVAGRRAHHDALDAGLGAWAAGRKAADAAAALAGEGVPAVVGREPRLLADSPQLRSRRYFEEIDHPVVGRRATPTVPFRYASVERWLRCAAPTLGQHNREILGGLLGCSDEELLRLEAAGIIGTRPSGV